MKPPGQKPISIIKIIVVLVIALVIAGCIGVFLGYSKTQEVPEYYQRAKAKAKERTPRQLQQIGASFDRRMAALMDLPSDRGTHAGDDPDEWLRQLTQGTASAPSSDTRWQEVFKEELNAWLATELTRKFPRMLPAGVTEPQVKISDGMFQLGFRYQQGNVQGVVTLELEATMTARPSEIAVRVRNVSMGTLPLPLSRVLSLISETGDRAAQTVRTSSNLVEWIEQGSDHIALIKLPTTGARYVTVLEGIDLREGEADVHLMRRPKPGSGH